MWAMLLLLVVVTGARGDDGALSSQVSEPSTDTSTRGTRGLFAPRVEYDEWTPLGHGDPLKNDPTYDYVPPVLERVRYWIEPPSRSPEPIRQTHHQTNPYHHSPTTYISTQRLPLHSTLQYNNADSRRDAYPFLTLVDGPKFNLPQSSPYKPHSSHQQQYQVVPRPPSQHFSRPYRTQQTAARPMTTPTQPPTSWLDLNMQQQQIHKQMQQQQYVQITRQPVVLLTPATPTSTVAPPPSPSMFTTPTALTTDPLFAHYKQPSEPLQGPMYLIIEGHSKVKTYGASKTIHGIPVDANLRRQKRRRRRRRKLRKRSAL